MKNSMKKIHVWLLSIQFLLAGLLHAQDSTLQVLFVGDVMQHGGQIAAAYNAASDSYDYKDCFKFVKPIIQQADISVSNL
jgi:poly-gamma-glutamate synthesis protein (capsule biosynthesis protein)